MNVPLHCSSTQSDQLISRCRYGKEIKRFSWVLFWLWRYTLSALQNYGWRPLAWRSVLQLIWLKISCKRVIELELQMVSQMGFEQTRRIWNIMLSCHWECLVGVNCSDPCCWIDLLIIYCLLSSFECNCVYNGHSSHHQDILSWLVIWIVICSWLWCYLTL